MKKLMGLVVLLCFLLPFSVHAADFTVVLTCPAKVDPNQSFNCSITSTDETLVGVQFTIDLTNASGIQTVSGNSTASIVGAQGVVAFKATSNASGTQKIKLTNIKDGYGTKVADDIEVYLQAGSTTQTNPKTDVETLAAIVLVVLALSLSGLYILNKNKKFASI